MRLGSKPMYSRVRAEPRDCRRHRPGKSLQAGMRRTAQVMDDARSMRCAGLLSRLAYNHLRSRHIDPLPLLEKSGLNVGAVSALDAPIPVGSQIKFLKLAAETLEDPLLGF